MKGDFKRSIKNMDEYDKFMFWFGVFVGIALPVLSTIIILIQKEINYFNMSGYVVGALCFKWAMGIGSDNLKRKLK